MKTLLLVSLGLALGSGVASAASLRGDLKSAQERAVTVNLAGWLAKAPKAQSESPASLRNPFNPPGFDAPDAPVARSASGVEVPRAIPVLTERQQLEEVVARLDPIGMMLRGDSPVLAFKGYQCAVGDVMTMRDTGTGRSYEFALVAIAPTTFTVEYKGETITRPIRKGP